MKELMMRVFKDKQFEINSPKFLDDKGFFARSIEINKYDYYVVVFLDESQLLTFVKEEMSQLFSNIKVSENYQKEISKNLSLIICLKLNDMKIRERTRKIINDIEENPYYFKKYILPYTDKQLEELERLLIMDLLNEPNIIKCIQKQVNDVDAFKLFKQNVEEESIYNLVIKMFVKIPFLKLEVVPRSQIDSLQTKINKSLTNDFRILRDTILSINIEDAEAEDALLQQLGVK